MKKYCYLQATCSHSALPRKYQYNEILKFYITFQESHSPFCTSGCYTLVSLAIKLMPSRRWLLLMSSANLCPLLLWPQSVFNLWSTNTYRVKTDRSPLQSLMHTFIDRQFLCSSVELLIYKEISEGRLQCFIRPD